MDEETMEKIFGPKDDTEYDERRDTIRSAGRNACQTLDLPITDAAFDLIDKVFDALRETVEYSDDLDDLVDTFPSECGDWMSGSGVISCYTSTQVHQWADLGAWQGDLDEYRGDDVASATDIIGRELSGIAYTIANAMADMVVRVYEGEE